MSTSETPISDAEKTPPREERGRERGSILPLMAFSLAFLFVSVALVAGVADRAARRAQAQSAADAASLAGVADGRAAAVRLASANNATLVAFDSGENEVSVVVEFDGIRATATAERHLGLDPGE